MLTGAMILFRRVNSVLNLEEIIGINRLPWLCIFLGVATSLDGVRWSVRFVQPTWGVKGAKDWKRLTTKWGNFQGFFQCIRAWDRSDGTCTTTMWSQFADLSLLHKLRMLKELDLISLCAYMQHHVVLSTNRSKSTGVEWMEEIQLLWKKMSFHGWFSCKHRW